MNLPQVTDIKNIRYTSRRYYCTYKLLESLKMIGRILWLWHDFKLQQQNIWGLVIWSVLVTWPWPDPEDFCQKVHKKWSHITYLTFQPRLPHAATLILFQTVAGCTACFFCPTGMGQHEWPQWGSQFLACIKTHVIRNEQWTSFMLVGLKLFISW